MIFTHYRRKSGGSRTPVQVKSSRMSPGPSIYRTMPLSPTGAGRTTPGGGGGGAAAAGVTTNSGGNF